MTILCGHRGARGYAPENTLAAFRLAREMGATWIEFDVQLSADGEVILLHDDTLERTTSLRQPVRPTALTVAELQALDAGSWFDPRFAGEKIPTLREMLMELRGTLGFNIEIKSKLGFEPDNGIEAKVVQIVRDLGLENEVLISSFDFTRLARLHEIAPDLRTGALYNEQVFSYLPNFDPIAIAQSLGAVAIHPAHYLIDAGLVERARAANLQINTWTVNEPADMQRLLALSVDMIITDYPDKLKDELGRMKDE
jgi:glycerophosphoryl diester phosphodiesterase